MSEREWNPGDPDVLPPADEAGYAADSVALPDGLSEQAQEHIDRVLERPGQVAEEFAVWCVNKIWTHPHSHHRTYDDAAKAIPDHCHYGKDAEFVVLARQVRRSAWRQPAGDQ